MLPRTKRPKSKVAESAGAPGVTESSKATETIDEIRFYMAHGMPAQAMAALAKLQTLTNDQATARRTPRRNRGRHQPAEEELRPQPSP